MLGKSPVGTGFTTEGAGVAGDGAGAAGVGAVAAGAFPGSAATRDSNLLFFLLSFFSFRRCRLGSLPDQAGCTGAPYPP